MTVLSPPSASDVARRLISMPTVNPPGNEASVQRYLASLIESFGIEVEQFEKVRGRPNLVARLRGTGARAPLVLHGHVDVVGVEGQRWAHPPFDSVVVDGMLHGRGALDMKSGVAMLTNAFLRAAADGLEPAGDIVLVVAVDSETGGAAGMAYLLDEHPDIVDGARYAIGEFGGFPLHAFGRRFYRIGVALKRYAHLRLHLRGAGGHGSRPASGTVVGALGRALLRLDETPMPHHSTPVAEQVVESIARMVAPAEADVLRQLLHPTAFEDALDRLGAHRGTFEALFRDTANATVVEAGGKFNVIPSEATIEVDARLLPGRDVDAAIADIRAIVGDDDLVMEVVDAGPPVPQDYDPGLFGELSAVLEDLDPAAACIPYLFNESPDGRLFATRGIQHYGFLPMDLPPTIDLPAHIHGTDERVPLSAIEFGAEALHRLISRY